MMNKVDFWEQKMEIENLNPVQVEIYKAIKQMAEKATFTEFQLAKKIRENTKFEGKKKAGISLTDILEVVDVLNSEEIFYSIHVNSVNECLLKKETGIVELSLEAKQRRQKSEKSMEIFTSGDFSGKKGKSGKSKIGKEKRNERKKMSIYEDYDD